MLSMVTSILNNTDAMVYVTDKDTGEIIYVNDGELRDNE